MARRQTAANGSRRTQLSVSISHDKSQIKVHTDGRTDGRRYVASGLSCMVSPSSYTNRDRRCLGFSLTPLKKPLSLNCHRRLSATNANSRFSKLANAGDFRLPEDACASTLGRRRGGSTENVFWRYIFSACSKNEALR